jgi:hypothetical protein
MEKCGAEKLSQRRLRGKHSQKEKKQARFFFFGDAIREIRTGTKIPAKNSATQVIITRENRAVILSSNFYAKLAVFHPEVIPH